MTHVHYYFLLLLPLSSLGVDDVVIDINEGGQEFVEVSTCTGNSVQSYPYNGEGGDSCFTTFRSSIGLGCVSLFDAETAGTVGTIHGSSLMCAYDTQTALESDYTRRAISTTIMTGLVATQKAYVNFSSWSPAIVSTQAVRTDYANLYFEVSSEIATANTFTLARSESDHSGHTGKWDGVFSGILVQGTQLELTAGRVPRVAGDTMTRKKVSLFDAYKITYINVAPTVTMQRGSCVGVNHTDYLCANVADRTFQVTFTFDEPVSGMTGQELTLSSGLRVLSVSQGSSSSEYVADLQMALGHFGAMTISLAADAVTDTHTSHPLGNLASGNLNLIADTVAPNATLALAGPPPTASSPTFTVTTRFLESVTLNANVQYTDVFELTGCSFAGVGDFTGVVARLDGGLPVWDLTLVADASRVDDILVQVRPAVMQDIHLNPNVQSAVLSVAVDTRPPAATVGSVASLINAAFNVSMTLDEPVTLPSGEVQLSMSPSTGGTAALTTVEMRLVQSVSLVEYVFEIQPPSGVQEADFDLAVPTGTFVDANNNGNTEFTFAVRIDTVAPTVSSMTLQLPQGETYILNDTGAVALDWAYSETGISPQLDVGNMNLSNCVLTQTGPTSAQLVGAVGVQGVATVVVEPGTVQDAAGNPNTARQEFSWPIDTLLPVPVVGFAEASAVQAASETIVSSQDVIISVDWQEQVTGFTRNGVVVRIGDSVVEFGWDGNGQIYTLQLTVPDGMIGELTVEIVANLVRDQAGNLNQQVPVPMQVHVDTVRPVVAVTSTNVMCNGRPQLNLHHDSLDATLSFTKDINTYANPVTSMWTASPAGRLTLTEVSGSRATRSTQIRISTQPGEEYQNDAFSFLMSSQIAFDSLGNPTKVPAAVQDWTLHVDDRPITLTLSANLSPTVTFVSRFTASFTLTASSTYAAAATPLPLASAPQLTTTNANITSTQWAAATNPDTATYSVTVDAQSVGNIVLSVESGAAQSEGCNGNTDRIAWQMPLDMSRDGLVLELVVYGVASVTESGVVSSIASEVDGLVVADLGVKDVSVDTTTSSGTKSHFDGARRVMKSAHGCSDANSVTVKVAMVIPSGSSLTKQSIVDQVTVAADSGRLSANLVDEGMPVTCAKAKAFMDENDVIFEYIQPVSGVDDDEEEMKIILASLLVAAVLGLFCFLCYFSRRKKKYENEIKEAKEGSIRSMKVQEMTEVLQRMDQMEKSFRHMERSGTQQRFGGSGQDGQHFLNTMIQNPSRGQSPQSSIEPQYPPQGSENYRAPYEGDLGGSRNRFNFVPVIDDRSRSQSPHLDPWDRAGAHTPQSDISMGEEVAPEFNRVVNSMALQAGKMNDILELSPQDMPEQLEKKCREIGLEPADGSFRSTRNLQEIVKTGIGVDGEDEGSFRIAIERQGTLERGSRVKPAAESVIVTAPTPRD